MPNARRVVLLEADTINRFSTERILRREDYWVFATDEASAAMRVSAVSAIDLVLVDVGLGRLEAIPRWQRRRGDATFHGVPESVTDGYAVLRPLHVDPSSARFPVVTLKLGEQPAEQPPLCRFAVVEFLPRPWKASGLVEGLDALFRDLVRATPPGEGGDRPVPSGPPPGGAGARRPDLPPVREHPGRAAHRPRGGPGRRRPPRARRLPRRARLLRARGRHRGRGAPARRRAAALARDHGDSLPDESGLAFCRRVRGHSLLRRTPVVFLSARDECESRYQAMKAGADDYLAKPAPSRELLIRLELLLRRFAEIELGGEGGRPARSGRAGGRPRGAADLPPQPAHRRPRGPPRQPVRPHRVPPRPGRLGGRPRPRGAARRLRLHRLAAGPVRVRPGRGHRGPPSRPTSTPSSWRVAAGSTSAAGDARSTTRPRR